MRHGTSQVAVLVENNTIRARALATIKLGSICHNWKLQIGWWDSEWKTLIIVLGVRIAVAPDGLTVLVVSTARAHRIVDVILGIVVIAAGSTVGLACENIGGLALKRPRNRRALDMSVLLSNLRRRLRYTLIENMIAA